MEENPMKKRLIALLLVLCLSVGLLSTTALASAIFTPSSAIDLIFGRPHSHSCQICNPCKDHSCQTCYPSHDPAWCSTCKKFNCQHTKVLTFCTNGGLEMCAVHAVSGTNIDLSCYTPYRIGYEFLGWYLGNEQWSFVGFAVTDDITLVAKWREIGTLGLEFYPLPNGTYGVMAGNTQYLETIIIPSTYNGIAVTQIMPNAFKDSSNLIEITFPNSINLIHEDAFLNCDKLEIVNIESIEYWCNIRFKNAI